MTAPKPGDRVLVEFEATYLSKWPHDGSHAVDVAIERDETFAVGVPAGAKLTVLPKPLRVGDKVRLGADPEPPVGTVLVYEDREAAPLARRGYGWTYASDSPEIYAWQQFAAQREIATVVWLREDES